MKTMTQAQYAKNAAVLKRCREDLRSQMVTPEEAIEYLTIKLRYGKTMVIKLVDEWGKGIYLPYAQWSKIKI